MATQSEPHALSMLAKEAKRRGIQILVEHETNAHYATSHRNPDVVYRVAAQSCTYPGFLLWGRCTHLAALHAEEGRLPPDDEPDPPAPAGDHADAAMPCPACLNGIETISAGTARERRIPCQTCCGLAVVAINGLVAAVAAAASVLWPGDPGAVRQRAAFVHVAKAIRAGAGHTMIRPGTLPKIMRATFWREAD
jgi:hypothetical protein